MNLQTFCNKNTIVLTTTVITVSLSVLVVQAHYLCHSISKKYFEEAKITNNFQKSLVYLELASYLDPTTEHRVIVAEKLVSGGLYTQAEQYLRGLKGELAEKSFAKAKYGNKNYLEAARLSSKYLDDVEMTDIYVRSLLKVGDLAGLGKLNNTTPMNSITTSLVALATGINPGSGLTARAKRLKDLGYPQSTLAVLEQAAKVVPLDRDAYFMLGSGYIELSRKDMAYSYYQKAQLADPYYPQVYQQLIRLGKDLGRANETFAYEQKLAALSW